MKNRKVREAAAAHGVKLWQIADRLGMNDGNFSRMLRKDLPEQEQEKILVLIAEIAEERTDAETVEA